MRGGEIGHFRKKKLNITKFFSKQDIKYKVNKKNNFKNSLKKTIINHMISDTKIGIAISSGLDSRSICALLYILKLNRQIFKAYFIEFSDFKIETTEVIRFCNHFKINLEIIKIKSIDTVKNFEKCLKYNEAPLGGIMNIALFALCKKAKIDNVKVILGGYGLDEALGGYDILNPNLNSKK